MSDNPNSIALEGLCLDAEDYYLLMELSALDAKNFLAKTVAFAKYSMDTMKLVAYSLPHNLHLTDPMAANKKINQLTCSLNEIVLHMSMLEPSGDLCLRTRANSAPCSRILKFAQA